MPAAKRAWAIGRAGPAMTGPGALVLSLLMLAGLLLSAGGLWLIANGGDRKRALLMLAAGLVMFGNVAIWMLPPG